jgi:hypothetical protein
MPSGTRAVSLLVALVLAASFATAARADKPTLALNPADEAKARTIVVQRADLGSALGWTGGAVKPSPPSSLDCAGYNPKQSDIVLTGRAKTRFKLPGLEVESEVQLLRSEGMVALDWRRTVTAPAVLPCLRAALAKGLFASQKLVSFARIPFEALGAHRFAFRAVVSVPSAGSTTRVLIDFVLVAVNRTEITLITTAPYSQAASVAPLERRLAEAMVARADRRIA